jgi:hypothetical protein
MPEEEEAEYPGNSVNNQKSEASYVKDQEIKAVHSIVAFGI